MLFSQSKRNAFTIVELMVAMVILGIISSMVAIALNGASRQAQNQRAQQFIDQLNLAVLQIYEEESQRRVNLTGTPVDAFAASQAQLIFIRDWLRATLPDSKADVDAGSGRTGSPTPGLVPFINNVPAVTPVGTTERSNAAARYRQRIIRTYEAITGGAVTWDAAYNSWTAEHESAECLYQILASNTVNGESGLQFLRTRDIADTDEDGMPEVVDSWGVPVAWMRSPAGFYLKNRWADDDTNSNTHSTVAELRETLQRLGPDPLDILRCDPRHGLVDDEGPGVLVDPTLPNATVEVHQYTFFCRPLVVSAGSDGDFDLVLTMPGTDRETIADDFGGSGVQTSPTNGTSYGLGSVYYPDPFYSRAVYDSGGSQVDPIQPLAERKGAVVDVNGDEVDNEADNIYPALGI